LARPDNAGNQHYKARALSGTWKISNTTFDFIFTLIPSILPHDTTTTNQKHKLQIW
jgi:hypothetical protein